MEHLLWILIWLTLNTFALTSNLRHLETERERHRRLAAEHNRLTKLYEQTDRSLDALTNIFEQSARRIETDHRVVRQRLQAQAEALIVQRVARTKNGSVEVARLFLTETDLMFLRGRPGLWTAFAEACRDVTERYFYQAIAGGAV